MTCNLDAHLALARQVAAESAVLLENDGELPLEGVRSGADSLAVIGALAKKPRYQGAGSSKIVPIALDSPFEALAEAGIAFDYAAGYDVATGESDDAAAEAAVECARTHDVAVLFVGLPARMESEGLDRSDMLLPMTQNDLVERICTVNPRTVVVLQGGAPFEMPWRHLPAAVLLTYLSGCQGGAATVDLLLGNANPSGHLAETWPVRLADTPTAQRFPSADREVLYTESIYIGYRYFDAVGLHVAYPFGHGLSYTTFGYDDLAVDIPMTVSASRLRWKHRRASGAESPTLRGGTRPAFSRPLRRCKHFRMYSWNQRAMHGDARAPGKALSSTTIPDAVLDV